MDRVERSRQISQSYRAFVESTIGSLLLFVDTKPLTLNSQRELRVSLSRNASESVSQLLVSLSSASAQIDQEARLRAFSDADEQAPRAVSQRVDSLLIRKSLIAEYNSFVMKVLTVYRQFQMLARSLIRTGHKETSARIRGKLAHKRTIGVMLGKTKSGKNIKAEWLMFLKIAHHLTTVAITSYIDQAARLGYSTFYVINTKLDPGIKHAVDEVPYSLFHPQSSAMLLLTEA